ncbi:unnamed protein product [Rhizophagus irregularis]|nr:unnamed protein product [Rhizophagus irregularis]
MCLETPEERLECSEWTLLNEIRLETLKEHLKRSEWTLLNEIRLETPEIVKLGTSRTVLDSWLLTLKIVEVRGVPRSPLWLGALDA